MTRFSFLGFGLAALVVLSGCSTGLTDRFPTSRRGNDRQADRRADRRSDDRSWNRFDRDARAYANQLDRQLRLSNRQERQIRDILDNRGDRLRRDGRSAYPFPRQTRGNRQAKGFWSDVDKRIERVLDRDQKRRYREMTRGRSNNGNRGNRGRGNRGRRG